MNKFRLLAFCLALIIATVSCKTKKDLVVKKDERTEIAPGPTAKQMVINTVKLNENTFSYYSARAKANYDDGDQKADLDISIVMEKDKYIWMNVTAILGIEVARVMITPDSVKILDRLHRKYIATDFAYLQKMSNVPLRLNNLQNLLAGNAVFDTETNKSVIDTVLGNLAVYTALGQQKQVTFFTQGFKAQRTTITDEQSKREMKVVYNKFYQGAAIPYPSDLDIHISAEKKVECHFELSNFVFEKKREVQFVVPKNYETVTR